MVVRTGASLSAADQKKIVDSTLQNGRSLAVNIEGTVQNVRKIGGNTYKQLTVDGFSKAGSGPTPRGIPRQ